jgi:hypothetical protein
MATGVARTTLVGTRMPLGDAVNMVKLLWTPLLSRILLVGKQVQLPETMHLPPEERTAVLNKAIHSAEYQGYQQRYGAWPCYMAIIFGSTPLGAADLVPQAGMLALLFWSMLVLAAVLVGLALGLFSRRLRAGVLGIVVVANIAGLFRCILELEFISALAGLVSAAIVYELTFTVGSWLVFNGGVRLLRSLAKDYLARDKTPDVNH